MRGLLGAEETAGKEMFGLQMLGMYDLRGGTVPERGWKGPVDGGRREGRHR
jgi:hypothetical protein